MLDPLQPGLELRPNVVDLRPNIPQGWIDADDPQAVRSLLALRRGPVSHQRNKVIFLESEPVEYIFFLIEGVVRLCRTFKDGKRSIVNFHVAGDFFGFDGGRTHSLCAEAATDARVLALKHSAVLNLAARNGQVANLLLANTTKDLRRLREHAVLMSRDAQCRLATFFIDLAVRTGKTQNLDLPMSHQDIADHLGLTIETVSRVITEFERAGWIARVSPRALILRNRAPLERMMT